MTKVQVYESRKEYNQGKNIRLDSDSDIPIIVIYYLISKNVNKVVKKFLEMLLLNSIGENYCQGEV